MVLCTVVFPLSRHTLITVRINITIVYCVVFMPQITLGLRVSLFSIQMNVKLYCLVMVGSVGVTVVIIYSSLVNKGILVTSI